MAVFGTLVSTALVGFGPWAILPYAGIALPLSYCLIFGALILPTDPITVMGILKSVGAPIILLGRVFRLPRGALQVLTWGGLRGGISVALALSLPSGQQRDVVLALLTYAVVVFSIPGPGSQHRQSGSHRRGYRLKSDSRQQTKGW